jgi:MFS family permease
VEGVLTDRLGARRIILSGFLILGAGLVSLSLIQNLLSFYIAFLVIFTGAGLAGFIPLMAAINHWFQRRRATAMAIGLTGTNIGGLLVPALAWSITKVGWRTTALVMGIAIWALAFPVTRFIRNRPEEYGLYPDGEPPETSQRDAASDQEIAEEDSEQNFTVGQAVRTTAFWAITVTHGFGATAFTTIAIHIVPALTDTGMSLTMAGVVVAVYTSTGVVFQLVGGFLGDRLPKPPLIAFFIATQGLGILIVAFNSSVPGAFLFAVVFGMGFGGRVPLLTAIRGDYFGRKSFATILGVSQLPMNLIMMGAPVLAGYLFDLQGTYRVPFVGLTVLNLMGAVLILVARKPKLPGARQRSVEGRLEE